MERASDATSWNSLTSRRTDPVRLGVLAGLVLVTVLGGLASFNPVIGILGSVLILPLTGGLARGAVIPSLRISQALLILGFLLIVLAKPTLLGKFRLTAIDL